MSGSRRNAERANSTASVLALEHPETAEAASLIQRLSHRWQSNMYGGMPFVVYSDSLLATRVNYHTLKVVYCYILALGRQ